MSTTGASDAATLGPYRLEELVGRGGMGDVYRAWDAGLERRVALKVLPARIAQDAAFRDRLLRESRLAAGLDHPNVVPVYDAGEVDDRLYLAMRYVEGTDLRALLRGEGALAPERVVAIAAQVASALDAAHARDLVHRDVKPSNVLIDESGHCYLADFGLSERVAGRAESADGALLGTLDYVAPEQIRGEPIGPAADTYSLGCLLFECLTGEAPFRRPSEVATVFAHLEEPVPRASERRPALPPAVDEALARGMAKEPGDRPPSCGALVEEVRTALGIDAPARTHARRWAIAATLVALAALAAAAVVVVSSRDSGAPARPGGELVRIDPAARTVAARYATPGGSRQVVEARGRVWFGAAEALWRLDPRAQEPLRVETVGPIHSLAAIDGQVFLAREGEKLLEGNVIPYDAVMGGRGDGVSLLACALTGDPVVGLWAAGCPNVQQLAIGPSGLSIAQTVPIPFVEPVASATTRACLCSMTVGDGSVWVLGDAADPRLWRVERSGRIAATIALPLIPRSIAATPGAVWVTAPLDDVVIRIDARTNRVVGRIPVGRGAAGIASSGDAVWVASTLDGTVSRIDAASGEVTDVLEVGGRPLELGAGEGAIWVTADAAP